MGEFAGEWQKVVDGEICGPIMRTSSGASGSENSLLNKELDENKGCDGGGFE